MGFWKGSSSPAYPDRRPADDAVNISINDFTLAMWVGPPAAYYYKTYLNGQFSDITSPNWFGGFRWFPSLEYSTSYDWYVEAYANDGETVIATSPTWTFTVEADPAPSKAINPAPTDAANNVTLDQATITWENGGGATSYDVYYGDTSGNLTLVSSGQAGLSFTITDITLGSPFEYVITRYWRIDSVNDFGTTTGDEWSFTTMSFAPPLPSGVSMVDGTPAGGTTGTPSGLNNMITVKRLVAAANNKFWYESI